MYFQYSWLYAATTNLMIHWMQCIYFPYLLSSCLQGPTGVPGPNGTRGPKGVRGSPGTDVSYYCALQL